MGLKYEFEFSGNHELLLRRLSDLPVADIVLPEPDLQEIFMNYYNGRAMNKMTYFRLIWKNHRSFAIFSMVFITLLQFLILYLITTFNMPAIIQTFLAQMPAKMKVYLSENFFSTLTLDGAAAFGFNHPLVLTLLAMNALNIPALHISREMESGSLELLLAHPFRRQSLILKLWISGCFLLLAIILAGCWFAFSRYNLSSSYP